MRSDPQEAENQPPSGWYRISLAEAGQWLSGGTPSTSNDEYWGGQIPWISAASLKDFHIRNSSRRLTPRGATNGSRVVQPGTTLFVVRGMSLKSEFRIGVAERDVAFGQDCKAIIPVEGIDPYFLAYAVKSRMDEILGMVEETSHGTGRLDTRRLQELEIDVPSVPEQQRIVAAHTAFERRISALERVLNKLSAASAALRAQVIRSAEDTIQLGAWLARIEAGKSPMADNMPAGDGEWGVLKVSAIQDGWFQSVENKVVRDPSLIDSRYEVRTGDLLMTRANTEELVGLGCIADDPPPRLMLSDKTLRLVINETVANPAYVQLVLAASSVRSQVRSAATGSTSSMKNISQTAIERLLVPDASLQKQDRAVDSLRAIGARRERLRKQIAKLRSVQQAMTEDLLNGRVMTTAGTP